jgi:hypothetical protein
MRAYAVVCKTTEQSRQQRARKSVSQVTEKSRRERAVKRREAKRSHSSVPHFSAGLDRTSLVPPMSTHCNEKNQRGEVSETSRRRREDGLLSALTSKYRRTVAVICVYDSCKANTTRAQKWMSPPIAAPLPYQEDGNSRAVERSVVKLGSGSRVCSVLDVVDQADSTEKPDGFR